MKPFVFAAALLSVAAAAWADAAKDASFSLTPGQYHWVQNTSVAGIPISEDNTECLTPESAKTSLSYLAHKLEKGCTVDEVVPAKDGYGFKLVCSGKIPGSADAHLVHSDKAMSLTANGSAKVLGMMAAFTAKADATYLGDCTAEQLEKAAKKEAQRAGAAPTGAKTER